MEEVTKPLYRRTLLAGAAWTVPTLAVAAAAPVMAASGQGSDPCPTMWFNYHAQGWTKSGRSAPASVKVQMGWPEGGKSPLWYTTDGVGLTVETLSVTYTLTFNRVVTFASATPTLAGWTVQSANGTATSDTWTFTPTTLNTVPALEGEWTKPTNPYSPSENAVTASDVLEGTVSSSRNVNFKLTVNINYRVTYPSNYDCAGTAVRNVSHSTIIYLSSN